MFRARTREQILHAGTRFFQVRQRLLLVNGFLANRDLDLGAQRERNTADLDQALVLYGGGCSNVFMAIAW